VSDLAARLDPGRTEMLANYDIMDTAPEEAFDDIVFLARDICEVPIALVSLVDDSRQWFKAKVGLDACETGLDNSVCAHGLAAEELLIIPDLKRDPRTADMEIVNQKPAIRFYAGAPLRTARGHTLGMLCVIDQFPRPTGLTSRQERALKALARQTVANIDLRRLIRERDAALAALSLTAPGLSPTF
jgi:GAF domain-containing protein